MIDIRIERKLIDFFTRLVAGIVLLIILTSCSPFAALATSAPTAAPTSTPAPEIRAPSPPAAIPKRAQTCQVNTGMAAGYLNLRTGAGVGYEVIRVLSEGETLQVIQRAPWLKVIDEQGNQGFINGHFCK